MQPAYLTQAVAAPQAEHHEPGYYEFPGPLVQVPGVWEQLDAAEYPDQALFCPDEQEYSEEFYPGSCNLDESGFEG